MTLEENQKQMATSTKGIDVRSEIESLEKVLLHRPGTELEHLYPSSLQDLLFDDIPYLERAQEEHDFFADILRKENVEVVYLEDLMTEILDENPNLKMQFIKDFLKSSGIRSQQAKDLIAETLNQEKSNKDLILKTMTGLMHEEVEGISPKNLAQVVGRETQVFLLEPIPNLYFTRDAFSSIGKGASIHHMFSRTRRRESIYSNYLFAYHPDFKGTPLYYTPEMPPSIEGGDIIVLNDHVLAVGLSQRTGPGALETLAENILGDSDSGFDTILALKIPSRRAFMHLDTVFTQLDYDKFIVHPGILESLEIFKLTLKDVEIDSNGQKQVSLNITQEKGSIESIFTKYLELEKIHFYHCGGNSRIAAEREQWNDGSNTLCVSPGKIIVYDRNTVTNRILEEAGITCLKMPSSELSRGRGGPRCMSMPLRRKSK